MGCWFRHDWGPVYETGGGRSKHMLVAVFESVTNPHRLEQKCKKCGKVRVLGGNAWDNFWDWTLPKMFVTAMIGFVAFAAIGFTMTVISAVEWWVR